MHGLDAPLPKEVETGGKRYAINTDWRVALRIFTALEDETLAEFERQAVMLRLLYKRAIPPDAGEAVRLAVKLRRAAGRFGSRRGRRARRRRAGTHTERPRKK
ncbi:MAG: Gp15 family bacteriophage protein [Ruthenibacterium sp.]